MLTSNQIIQLQEIFMMTSAEIIRHANCIRWLKFLEEYAPMTPFQDMIFWQEFLNLNSN